MICQALKGIQTPHCLSQLTGRKTNLRGKKPSQPDFSLHQRETTHPKKQQHMECPNPCGKSVCVSFILCKVLPTGHIHPLVSSAKITVTITASLSHTDCHTFTPLLPSVRVNAANSSTTATRVRRGEAILNRCVFVRCAGGLCAGVSQAVSALCCLLHDSQPHYLTVDVQSRGSPEVTYCLRFSPSVSAFPSR